MHLAAEAVQLLVSLESNPIAWLLLLLLCTDFPVASVQDSYLEVMEGQSASLVCFVSGNPLPDITWRDRMDAVLQNAGEIFHTYAPPSATVQLLSPGPSWSLYGYHGIRIIVYFPFSDLYLILPIIIKLIKFP